MCVEGEQRVKGLAGTGGRNWERAEGGYWGCLAAWGAPSFRILEEAAQRRWRDPWVQDVGCRAWSWGPLPALRGGLCQAGTDVRVPAELGDKDTDTQSVALLRSLLITGGCQ